MANTPPPTPLNPDNHFAQVERYAKKLQLAASEGKVTGLLAFEEHGDGNVHYVPVGSTEPLSPRMLMGLLRFVLAEISGQ